MHCDSKVGLLLEGAEGQTAHPNSPTCPVDPEPPRPHFWLCEIRQIIYLSFPSVQWECSGMPC